MISLFRKDPEQGWHYREAWHDASTGEFVIHHGKVGTNGKTSADRVDQDNADSLMESFVAQCEEDGYAELGASELHALDVTYTLKDTEPMASETRNANTLYQAVLVALAWKGLGVLTEPELRNEDGKSVLAMTVQTVHWRKAIEAAESAIKGADVPNNKVQVVSQGK